MGKGALVGNAPPALASEFPEARCTQILLKVMTLETVASSRAYNTQFQFRYAWSLHLSLVFYIIDETETGDSLIKHTPQV